VPRLYLDLPFFGVGFALTPGLRVCPVSRFSLMTGMQIAEVLKKWASAAGAITTGSLIAADAPFSGDREMFDGDAADVFFIFCVELIFFEFVRLCFFLLIVGQSYCSHKAIALQNSRKSYIGAGKKLFKKSVENDQQILLMIYTCTL
jgi:hypothetical protein